MTHEEQMIQCLKNLSKQINSMQTVIARLDSDVRNMKIRGNAVVKKMPFGVKDISSAQLVDAYRRGMNMEQLVALSNGKYSPEQIYTKLRKAGAIQ